MEFKQTGRIDLHIHSAASDGTLSPDQILRRALTLNLKAVAITDHDTIEGSKAALSVENPDTIQLLSGVEISAAPPKSFSLSGSFHILGYGIRLKDASLNATLKRLQEARKNRNPKIIECLNDRGFPLTLESLQAEFPGGQIGRPHIAQLMVKRGFVKTIDEAFDRFLGKGKPAYVEKYRLSYIEAIETIRGAGGIAVLAHPSLLKTDGGDFLEDLLQTMKKGGLQGVEVYYPDHTPRESEGFAAMAQRLGLLMTGGTDFHGKINPAIEMGYGRGDFHVPYTLYEALQERLRQPAYSARAGSGGKTSDGRIKASAPGDRC